jgi:hypothetical protein
MSKKSAARQILEGLNGKTNVVVRLSTEVNDRGQTTDLRFDTWAAEAFLYDEDGLHPDTGRDGYVRIGSATALVLDYGWDTSAVVANLDDHSEWYAEIGAKLTPDDRPGLGGLYERFEEELFDFEGNGLLIIPEIEMSKEWRGRGLSIEIINAIAKSVGRFCAFTVIDPEIYDEEVRDAKATSKVVKKVVAAGFVRWYSTSLFIRSSVEALDLSDLSEPEVIPPRRHTLDFGALIATSSMGLSDHDSQIGIPLPAHPRSRDHVYPSELGRFSLHPVEAGSTTATITISLAKSRSEVTVGLGPDGSPVVAGLADPAIVEAISPWALAVYADCIEFGPVIESVISETIRRWIDGAPLPEPEANDFVAHLSLPPRFTTLPRWVEGGEPFIEQPGTLSRTAVVHRVHGQSDVPVGAVCIEWPEVVAEIQPDLPWPEDDVNTAVEWMLAVGGRQLGVMMIASIMAHQAYTHLGSVDA